MKKLAGLTATLSILLAGCVADNPPDTSSDAPIIKEFKETRYKVQKKTNEIGQESVTTVINAGDKTGVNRTVTGISEAIVNTSEEIGQEQKGDLMGSDVTLFPQEAENDGKVLRIDF